MTLPTYFNWIDYVILGIIAFSTIISFFRGFVRETISLIAWVSALLVALKYANILQIYLTQWISSESIRYVIAFIGIFLAIVIAGLIINILFHLLIKAVGLSLTDRLIGVFFGAARGIAIVAVLLLMLTHLGTVSDNFALKKSRLANRFYPVVAWLNEFLPDKMKIITQWVQNDWQKI